MAIVGAGALGFVTSTTFALLRRFYGLVWIGIGLLCLAMIGKNGIEQEEV